MCQGVQAAAFAGRQTAVQRQSCALTLAAPALQQRCVVAHATEREPQSLTGEWSANWSLASCESRLTPAALALALKFVAVEVCTGWLLMQDEHVEG
jgi:hypothetical protein